MKVYISADLEGITSVTHWNETELARAESEWPRRQMTAEVAAACQGALDAGADEIWVQDAHDDARNIDPSALPRQVTLVRGWSGHPFMMQQELDESFDALALVGYHSRFGSAGNPLAHSMSLNLSRMTINGQDASEFHIAAYTAAYTHTPLVLVAGDAHLCEEVTAFNPNITIVPVKRGVGGSTISIHPELAAERIRQALAAALLRRDTCHMALPDHFVAELTYREAHVAFHNGFYPGARLVDARTVRYEHDDFFELMRFMAFTL